MDYKDFTSFVKEVNNRQVIGYVAAMGNIDSGGDRIFNGAFKKTIKENIRRVQHLWQHDFMAPPIAVVQGLREVKAEELPDELRHRELDLTGALEVTREYLNTPRADEVLQGIVSGAIKEMSIGYDPVKFDFEEDEEGKTRWGMIRNLREIRLWDTSDVNWGMNSATVASKMDAGDQPVVFFSRGVVKDMGTELPAATLADFTELDEEHLLPSEKVRIAHHYAYGDPDNPSGLKLLHHQPAKKGVGPAVWMGVRNSMFSLLKGDVEIPAGQRRSVYDHLVKHYDEFGVLSPDYKVVELSYAVYTVGDIEPLLAKEGRVLSARNLQRLKDAIDALQQVLAAAEPSDAESDTGKVSALTANVLRRLEIAERLARTL